MALVGHVEQEGPPRTSNWNKAIAVKRNMWTLNPLNVLIGGIAQHVRKVDPVKAPNIDDLEVESKMTCRIFQFSAMLTILVWKTCESVVGPWLREGRGVRRCGWYWRLMCCYKADVVSFKRALLGPSKIERHARVQEQTEQTTWFRHRPKASEKMSLSKPSSMQGGPNPKTKPFIYIIC